MISLIETATGVVLKVWPSDLPGQLSEGLDSSPAPDPQNQVILGKEGHTVQWFAVLALETGQPGLGMDCHLLTGNPVQLTSLSVLHSSHLCNGAPLELLRRDEIIS